MAQVGEQAPDFSQPGTDGRDVTLSEFRGDRVVVLYFYPKDETPGCTVEACGFRDHYADFVEAGAVVIGVSADSIERHLSFKSAHDLPFLLVSDGDNSVRESFAVPKTFGVFPGRTTYVIDKQGVVRHLFNSQIRFRQHVDSALAVVRDLCG